MSVHILSIIFAPWVKLWSCAKTGLIRVLWPRPGVLSIKLTGG
jgi:hypothetical protein